MNVGICQQTRLEEKGKDLLMTAGLLNLLALSPEKPTPSPFSPSVPRAWPCSRLSQRVELDQVSSPGVYGMQPYLAFKNR